ncbi:MAG: MBL fold metallo-hydrolase, partial [Gammaproteobacteria bacterium]|nr:MBL fold metallo-hydrolase [Gammaproteobacteria bacterium]
MAIQIQFLGAAREVTGSSHLVQVGERRILLDCGLIQGPREEEERNRAPFPFDPKKIDVVILSHAHIDHSGRLPMLVNAGFRGPIYTH